MTPRRPLAAPNVKMKLAELEPFDAPGDSAMKDPWHAFRHIEVLDLELKFQFRHSLGKCSRFFLELERHRLFATRCPKCQSVWMPPRAVCGNDLAITEWVELSGRGTIVAIAVCAYTLNGPTNAAAEVEVKRSRRSTQNAMTSDVTMGYVALDGASTLLFQRIKSGASDGSTGICAGKPVEVVWSDHPVDHPMELFWFEPTGTKAPNSPRGQVT